MAIITLEEAKRRLRILHDFEDAAIEEAIDLASAIVFDYIKREYEPATDDLDGSLKAATLIMLSHFWDNRGSENVSAGLADGYLPQNFTMLLHRKRDPAIA